MVKKLPVLLIGKISAINKNKNGIIILLSFNEVSKIYFLKKVLYKVMQNILKIIINPNKPVSVKIYK